MLQAIRNFSSTIYAKIILVIMIIPFVLWGMGGAFSGGSKNIIVTINKEKLSVDSFVNFISSLNLDFGSINENQRIKLLDELLKNFIGQQLLAIESRELGIKVTDRSLSLLIENDKNFLKNNIFSRAKYEKFLIEGNLNAVSYENYLRTETQKELLLNFIENGVLIPFFLTNEIYNQKNQVRKVKYVDLNKFYNEEQITSEEKVKKFYDDNKEVFTTNFRSINFVEISPENLTDKKEFSDVFFELLDEIDNLVVENFSIKEIANKFNLKIHNTELFDLNGKNKNREKEVEFNTKILNKIFKLENQGIVSLINDKDQYYLVELNLNTKIAPNLNDELKNKINVILKVESIKKINKDLKKEIIDKKFDLEYLEKFSKKNNLNIKVDKIENFNDVKIFNKEIVDKIYKMPINTFRIISNNNMNKNFIVFISNIEEKNLKKGDKEFDNYYLMSKNYLTNNIYAGYDQYLNKKYKVNINQQTLERIKNNW